MPDIEHAMAASSGALFGKYEVGRLLGCGAFAKVYHARDVRSGQSVAIKVISKKRIIGSASSSANLVANIKREISIMRRLSHPHIVRLHEVLATKTKIYFVMELVKGGELFARVSKGRFTEELGRRYFRQLISAVGYCHSRGVFHRDLKPENLLLADDGNLKVTDFGLSAVAESIRPDGLLHTLCGTPAYVAPEILAKRGYDGAKIDVWSCGVILFVLIAGYLPFNDPNLMNMYRKIYKGEYRCPKWMSGELRAFLARLLDINPETRITVDGILHDPWFKKGSTVEIKFYHDEEVDDSTKLLEGSSSNGGGGSSDGDLGMKSLNAFDLISFSSGLNLSGLFDLGSGSEPAQEVERIVVRDEPDKLVERVVEVASSAGLRARRRKEWAVQVNGLNGKLSMMVVVYRLTDVLAMVEARNKGGDPACFADVWTNRVRPELVRVDGPEPTNQVAGDDEIRENNC